MTKFSEVRPAAAASHAPERERIDWRTWAKSMRRSSAQPRTRTAPTSRIGHQRPALPRTRSARTPALPRPSRSGVRSCMGREYRMSKDDEPRDPLTLVIRPMLRRLWPIAGSSLLLVLLGVSPWGLWERDEGRYADVASEML